MHGHLKLASAPHACSNKQINHVNISDACKHIFMCDACVFFEWKHSCTSMAATGWVKIIQAVMDMGSLSINQKAHRIMETLKAKHWLYDATLAPPELLTHPDCINKGIAISEMGWDFNKLRESVCIELPKDEAKRLSYVEANKKFAELGDGRLASPNGSERFCTLSCSHTTAFMKAMHAGCAPKSGLALDALINSGDDFANMLNQGWQWKVLAAECEQHFPSLPGLLQQALNSHRAVFNLMASLFVEALFSMLLVMRFSTISKQVVQHFNLTSGDLAIGKPPSQPKGHQQSSADGSFQQPTLQKLHQMHWGLCCPFSGEENFSS